MVTGLLVLSAVATPADGEVVVAIEGLRSGKGQILVCLTAKAGGFPDCRKDPQARKQAVPASQGAAIRFSGLPAGRYAMAVIHDENGNGKPDMALMIPREGFGFSRNPPIGFGPPSFRRAAFVVEGQEVRMAIRIRYMF